MLASLAAATLALLVLQVLLVVIARFLVPALNVYVTIVVVSLITAPAVFAAASTFLPDALTATGRSFLVLLHLTLGGFFFHFITLPDRSVTLRILVELLQAPGQALSTTALGRQYGVRTMITSRLEQLADGRFIEIAPDQRIALTSKGLLFGRFVTAGRNLFRIGSAN
jgi:hypothetical protein